MSWKRALYLTHRWAGIGLCLLFAMWFATGIVMMYVPFPNLDPVERYAGLEPIEGNHVHVSVVSALAAAGIDEVPQRVRMTSVLGRPAFHFLPEHGRWVTVFADTAERLQSVCSATGSAMSKITASRFATVPSGGMSRTVHTWRSTISAGFALASCFGGSLSSSSALNGMAVVRR